MKETRKSPRKVEEEVNKYHRDRFEWYMQQVDAEQFTLEVALSALRK